MSKLNICPVCGAKTQDTRNGGERGIQHHINNKAKSELWYKHFDKKIITPHLDYFMKNYTVGKVEISYKFH
jgi:hypothetical protein